MCESSFVVLREFRACHLEPVTRVCLFINIASRAFPLVVVGDRQWSERVVLGYASARVLSLIVVDRVSPDNPGFARILSAGGYFIIFNPAG